MWHTVVLPYTLWKWIAWQATWVWRFGIKREEYDEEAKLYLIRKNVGISESQFNVSFWDFFFFFLNFI